MNDATRIVRVAAGASATRAPPNRCVAASTSVKASTPARTSRHTNPRSHAQFATAANHATRKLTPQSPVTETIWMRGKSSVMAYAAEPQVP